MKNAKIILAYLIPVSMLLLAMIAWAGDPTVVIGGGGDVTTSDVSGTANRVIVIDNAPYGVRVTTPQDLHTGTNFTVNALTATSGVQFGLTNVLTHSEGAVHWDDEERALEVDTEIPGFHLLIGQQVVVRSKNISGGPLSAGNVVIVSDAAGKRTEIIKADADSEALSDGTLGLVAHAIADNNTGYVVTEGILNGVDTSAFSEGDTLYLSSTPGAITNVPVVAPKHSVTLGKCTRSHPSDGRIYVRIHEGVEMGELHDVLVSSVAANDILTYDSGDSRWENKNSVVLTNAQVTNVAIGNTVGGTYQSDIWQRTGDGAAGSRIASFGTGLDDGHHFSIINGLDPTKTTFAANQEVFTVWFDKPGSTSAAFFQWAGPTHSNAAVRGNFTIQTQVQGNIYIKPAGAQAFKADTSRNIYTGADLTATTAMVNSIGVATGECGTTNPTTYATLCVEPVTTAAGTTAKVMRVRHGDGDETTLSRSYGSIYIHNHDSPVNITPSGFAFTNVTGATNKGTARMMTEAGSSGYITMLNSGPKVCHASASVSGPSNETVNLHFGVNGTVQNEGTSRKVSVAGDVGSAAVSALFPSLSANDRVSVMANSTASGGTIPFQAYVLVCTNP